MNVPWRRCGMEPTGNCEWILGYLIKTTGYGGYINFIYDGKLYDNGWVHNGMMNGGKGNLSESTAEYQQNVCLQEGQG